ncbi:MAG: DUF1592 domain-containing protein [Myxococcales bacterium]|nr:DUF1592 domain-containing protein [Myxococcales bacterium]
MPRLPLALALLLGCAPDAPSGTPAPAVDAAISPPDAEAVDAAVAPAEDAESPDAGPAPDAARPAPPPCPLTTVPVVPLRRLTPTQYRHTVQDLLGLPDADPDLAPDPAPALSLLGAEKFAAAARRLAAEVDVSPAGLSPCDPLEVGEDACGQAFRHDLAERLFRRPPSLAVLDWLDAVWATLPDDEGFEGRARLLVEVALQSPAFLYHLEQGEADARLPAGVIRLDDHSLANRLAYALWDAPPDATLRAAADAGRLQDPAEIGRQAERLLADPRGRTRVLAFFRQWLELERVPAATKSAELLPDWSPALAAAMVAESEALIERAVFEGGGLAGLLLGTDALVDAPLAALYGVDAPVGAPAWRPLDATQRAGILTRAAFLTLKAGPAVKSPIHRGAFIRRRLLCLPMPPPPASVLDVPITRGGQGDDGGPVSLRELVERRTAGPECQGCHAAINPIGFTLDHYDALGRFEVEESGYDRQRGAPYTVPIDARGRLPDADFLGAIDGGVALSQALAESEMVSDCFADQWFAYFFARPATADEDACSVEHLRAAFRASGGDFLALVRASTTLDAFRYRQEAP